MNTSLCFEFKDYMPFLIASSGNICGLKLGVAEVLFVSVFFESFSLEHAALGVSSLSIWLCGSSLLIEFSLN